MEIGLRIDVDTWRGTRDGVPRLCGILAERGVHATFFFSVGPDNMGRHLWRLLKPQFLLKMLRSKAASLYGWDILLRGTFWPGPVIGRGLAGVIRQVHEGGHEIGMHAWDHHQWQAQVAAAGKARLRQWTQQAVALLTAATGAAPVCAAAPGWRSTDDVLMVREMFSFRYNSDCRGSSIFRPMVDGKPLTQPQIPNTLPTYDEIIGQHGITNDNYNAHLLSLLTPGGLNVLTVHAEVEGIVCADLFAEFVDAAQAAGWKLKPLGELLPADPVSVPTGQIKLETIPGREGWVAVQHAL